MISTQQVDLDWLLKSRSILTHFQPIVSVKRQHITGIEALSRGISPDGKLLMPQGLFSQAVANEKNVYLDRLCREKALETYKQVVKPVCDSFLFLNLDISILDQGVLGSGHLLKTVQSLGLSPAAIVIEIIESKVHDTAALTSFIKMHKELGFLIALDDMGSDSSNLDRILHVRPDIIKIDRGLVHHIQQDYYKQELFKALVFVAQKTGALVVAEGVETHEEAVASLELGADFLQGYYIARPASFSSNSQSAVAKTIQSLVTAYRSSITKKIQVDHQKSKICKAILDALVKELSATHPESFENRLCLAAQEHSCVQCYYILNTTGIQITETVKASHCFTGKHHGMFHPDFCGSDQSLKDYFLFINAGFPQYISEPYLSLANGHPCRTGSTAFVAANGLSYILCVDFNL